MKFCGILPLLALPALVQGEVMRRRLHEWKKTYDGVPPSKIVYDEVDSITVDNIMLESFLPMIENNLQTGLAELGSSLDLGGTVSCPEDTGITSSSIGVTLGEVTSGLSNLDAVSLYGQQHGDEDNPAVRMHDYKAWWSGHYVLAVYFEPITIEATVEICGTGSYYITNVTFEDLAAVATLKYDGLTRYTGTSKITGIEVVDEVEISNDSDMDFERLADNGIPDDDLRTALHDLFVSDAVMSTVKRTLNDAFLMKHCLPIVVNDSTESGEENERRMM